MNLGRKDLSKILALGMGWVICGLGVMTEMKRRSYTGNWYINSNHTDRRIIECEEEWYVEGSRVDPLQGVVVGKSYTDRQASGDDQRPHLPGFNDVSARQMANGPEFRWENVIHNAHTPTCLHR
jgi:hypothetical protein